MAIYQFKIFFVNIATHYHDSVFPDLRDSCFKKIMLFVSKVTYNKNTLASVTNLSWVWEFLSQMVMMYLWWLEWCLYLMI